MDHVVEVAGTLHQSLHAIALGGQVAVVGFLSEVARPVDPGAVFTAGATLRPLAIGSRAQLAGLLRAVAAHRLQPVVDRVFPFAEAAAAFAHYLDGSSTGRAFGKVVVTTAGRH